MNSTFGEYFNPAFGNTIYYSTVDDCLFYLSGCLLVHWDLFNERIEMKSRFNVIGMIMMKFVLYWESYSDCQPVTYFYLFYSPLENFKKMCNMIRSYNG